MLRAVICKGDSTSHGGKVLEGNPNATTDGRPIALRGHMTVCPQCKGKYPIAEGLDFRSIGGIGMAVEGMRTACGATLVASEHNVLVDDQGGAAGGGNAGQDAAAGPSDSGSYRGAFRAVDESTGKPVPGLAYRIELPDGRTLRGRTDADGYTEQVSASDPATVSLHWETDLQSDAEH